MHKVKEFNFQFTLPFSAPTIWQYMANDYGNVANFANFANGITSSNYITDHSKGIEGCKRICKIDNKGKKVLIEKMVDIDEKNMTFTNLITEAKGLPIVPNLSKTVMSIKPINSGQCQFHIDVFFRTKPAFLARFMKKISFNQMSDLMIGLHHYINTNEIVTAKNFKKIKENSKHLTFNTEIVS